MSVTTSKPSSDAGFRGDMFAPLPRPRGEPFFLCFQRPQGLWLHLCQARPSGYRPLSGACLTTGQRGM